jgi:hypothetical protein
MQSIIYYNTICESESPTIIIVSFAKLVMDRGYGRTSGRKRFSCYLYNITTHASV